MKFALKGMVASAAFVTAGVAGAVTVTPGQTVSGSSQLSFGQEFFFSMDLLRMNVVAAGPAEVQLSKDTDGFYTQAAVKSGISSLSINDLSHKLSDVTTTGGFNLQTDFYRSLSNGGSVTVSDLRIDLVGHKVFADIISNAYTITRHDPFRPGPVNGLHIANALNAAGAKTLNNVYLFDIMGKPQYDVDVNLTGYDASTAIVGSTTMVVPGTYVNEFNGLKMTAEGFTVLKNGLGLQSGGYSQLRGTNDFGSITTTIAVTSVPEPSTYALILGGGLVCFSRLARRRVK